jgi:competence protein ComEC
MTAARVSPVLCFSLAMIPAILSPFSSGTVCLLIACLPAALALVLSREGGRKSRLLVLCLLAASFGWTAACLRSRCGPSPPAFSGIPLRQVNSFTGRLLEDSSQGMKGRTLYRLCLTAVSGPDLTAAAQGRVLVVVPGGGKLFMGQKLAVRGGLRPLGGRGAESYLSYSTPSGLVKDGCTGGLYSVRSRLRGVLDRRTEALTPGAAALIRALLFGEKETLNPETVARFRASGSYHVLALSGLHVGVLFILVSACFSFLPGRFTSFWIGALFTLLYLGLVGPRPSLTRAVLMLIAAGCARVLDRDSDPLNCLALAAGLILLADPAAVYSLSFQLSFLSLLGILCLGGEISRILNPHLPPLINRLLACSAGAQAASAPVLLAGFGVVHPVGILASLLVIPLVTLCVWLGLAYLLAAPLPVAGPVLAAVLKYLTVLLEKITEAGSRLPGWEIDWRLYTAVLVTGCLLHAAGRGGRKKGAIGYELRFTG